MTNYEKYKEEIKEARSNCILSGYFSDEFDIRVDDIYDAFDLYDWLNEEYKLLNCRFVVSKIHKYSNESPNLEIGRIYEVKDGQLFIDGVLEFPLGNNPLRSEQDLINYLDSCKTHNDTSFQYLGYEIVILKE